MTFGEQVDEPTSHLIFDRSLERGVNSREEVDDAVHALNHRPRKCLDYLTPHEVFHVLEVSPIKLPSDALCL